ncbi:MAG: phage tail protein [Deltaproteobacteria bacterium HGW-Deltaproteobacteria-8]|jgi:hypothetical protein|nr:MAG: phage tail protein [Deltaproteobacteria bacterium HGW-Deltaproteobacteria-8]
MTIEYTGAIVLSVDGKDFDVESCDVTRKTGRKAVKTMNRTGKPKGFAKGVAEFSLKITLPVTPGDPEWADVENAKITLEPLNTGDKRVSYTGCFTTDVGEKYQVDGEAKRDITVEALDRKVE